MILGLPVLFILVNKKKISKVDSDFVLCKPLVVNVLDVKLSNRPKLVNNFVRRYCLILLSI
jgi:hypothetical protein